MKTACMVSALILLSAACSQPKPQPEAEAQLQNPQTGLIEMKLEAQRHIGMQVAPAFWVQLSEYLQVTGTVQPIDSRIGEVRSLARGRVQQVLVKVGDRVETAQPLIRFDNIEAVDLIAQYNTAGAELERLKVQYATAMKQGERNQSLVEIGAVPQKDLELSQAEQRSLLQSIRAQESVINGMAGRLGRFGIGTEMPSQQSPLTTIDSPFSGVVLSAQVAPGEVVDTERRLFSIADLSRVWVQAEVYEKDLGRVRVGLKAFILVDTYPGETFSGRVAYVSNVLDPKTRTAKVRCEVANPGLRLKLDMFATVALPTKFNKQAIAVPAGAVQQIEGKNVVFVRKMASQFEQREVQIGRTVEGQTEITEGLSAGEPIVIQGAFHLKSIALGKELAEKE